MWPLFTCCKTAWLSLFSDNFIVLARNLVRKPYGINGHPQLVSPTGREQPEAGWSDKMPWLSRIHRQDGFIRQMASAR